MLGRGEPVRMNLIEIQSSEKYIKKIEFGGAFTQVIDDSMDLRKSALNLLTILSSFTGQSGLKKSIHFKKQFDRQRSIENVRHIIQAAYIGNRLLRRQSCRALW